MAKFNFALEKVLRHRDTLKDLAEKDFQAGMAILNAEIEILEKMLEKKAQAFESRFQREVQGGQAAEALTQVHEFLKGQDVRINRQRKKIQEFEKQVEELREALRLRAVDSKIMEGLRERKKEEFQTEQKKLEQKRMDDLSSSRFRSK